MALDKFLSLGWDIQNRAFRIALLVELYIQYLNLFSMRVFKSGNIDFRTSSKLKFDGYTLIDAGLIKSVTSILRCQ